MDPRDHAADEQASDQRSRWGRLRGSDTSTLWVAIPVAILLAVGIGVLVTLTGVAGPRPVVGGIAFAFVTVWPCFGLVWALVVDRETLHGAVDRPEESVESQWYDAAAGKAFTDVLLVVGLGTAVIAFGGLEPPAIVVLPGVIVVAMVAFGVRYLLVRTRG